MNKILLIILLTFSSVNIFSQETADTKYWIIFNDKGDFKSDIVITPGSKAYDAGMELLTERAVQRRLKVLSEENLIDYADLPVENSYIQEIKNNGIEVIAVSRWLNGISAYMTEAEVEKIKGLDFVDHLGYVKTLVNQKFEVVNEYIESEISDSSYKLDYGKSLKQMEMVNVPKVHDMYINGKGVMIASFDDGFDWKNHESLMSLNIIEEYDFVNKDPNTFAEKNQKYEDSKNQGSHVHRQYLL